jgi:hypothetical protein
MPKGIAKAKLRLNSRRSCGHVAYVRPVSGSIRGTEPVGRLQSPAGLGVESASSTRLTINTSCESDSDDNNGDDRCTRADARFLVLYPIRVTPRSLVSSPLDTRATPPSPLSDRLAHLFSRTRTLCPPLRPLHTLYRTLGPSHARSHHRKWRLERTSACPRERRASRKRSSTPSPARVRRRFGRRERAALTKQTGTTLRPPRSSRTAMSARLLSTARRVSVCLLSPTSLTAGNANDSLKGRVMEVSLADLNNDQDQSFRKIKLRVEDVAVSGTPI